MTVSADLKAGPAIAFRLTVWAADMDTVTTPMLPVDDRVAAALTITAGASAATSGSRPWTRTASCSYRGEAVRDVTNLVPLDLTIDLAPVAPLIYLNPHFTWCPWARGSRHHQRRQPAGPLAGGGRPVADRVPEREGGAVRGRRFA